LANYLNCYSQFEVTADSFSNGVSAQDVYISYVLFMLVALF